MKKLFVATAVTLSLATIVLSILFNGSSAIDSNEYDLPADQSDGARGVAGEKTSPSQLGHPVHENTTTDAIVVLSARELSALGNPEEAFRRLLVQKHLMPEETFTEFLNYFIYELALSNPLSGEALLAQYDAPETREQLLHGIMAGWINQDILRGFQLLDSSLMDGFPDELFFSSYNTLIHHYASVDPSGAAEILLQLDQPELIKQLAPPVAKKMAGVDPVQAFDWGLALGDESARHLALYNIVDTFSGDDVSWLMKGIVENQPSWDSYGIAMALRKLALSDPQAVASSLNKILPQSQEQVTQEVVSAWFVMDADSAINWVSSSAEGSVFQAGVETLADAVSKENPLAALHWAAKIDDSSKKIEVMQRVVHNASVMQMEQIRDDLLSVQLTHFERNSILELLNQSIAEHYLPQEISTQINP